MTPAELDAIRARLDALYDRRRLLAYSRHNLPRLRRSEAAAHE